MPEGLEAEIWRRAATILIGRRIVAVEVDRRVAPPDLADVLVDRRIEAVRRIGKVVLVDTDGPTLGLHFGMTGRLVLDGVAPIDRLEYASDADRPEWDRLSVTTDPSPAGPDVAAIRVNDPRRLGRSSIDPDLSAVGVDFTTIGAGVDADDLIERWRTRSASIKSVLLDQSVIAGLGNLCADEVLFWAGVAPARSVRDLDRDAVARIVTACVERLPTMLERGGSTHGLLTPEVRRAIGSCPLDGAPLTRTTLAGRTAVWCPTHQH